MADVSIGASCDLHRILDRFAAGAEDQVRPGPTPHAEARLLGPDNQPLPGLYAVGNDMQSIMGGVYPGPGITIGPALAFGYVAAMSATARARARAA